MAADTLARQLEEKLPSFGLSQELRNWGQECLDELRKGDLDQAQQIILERKRAYEHCIARMENLLNLKTAPENTDGSLLSDEEYQKQRIALLAQKKSLAYDTPAFEAELEGKTQVIASALDLATAIQANPGGDLTTLTNTLRALGSNHCLKSKELEIKPDFPFSELHRGETQAPSQLIRIEPDSSQAAQAPERGWRPRCPSTVPGSDDDRTISLKVSIKNIWERLKPGDPLIARFPYNNETSPVPRRRKPWTIRHRTFSKFGSVEPLGRGGISRRQGSEPTQ